MTFLGQGLWKTTISVIALALPCTPFLPASWLRRRRGWLQGKAVPSRQLAGQFKALTPCKLAPLCSVSPFQVVPGCVEKLTGLTGWGRGASYLLSLCLLRCGWAGAHRSLGIRLALTDAHWGPVLHGTSHLRVRPLPIRIGFLGLPQQSDPNWVV